MYDRFVDVVAEGRPGLDEPAVRRLADGRVYSASQALELGLIDRIAGMRDVIGVAKTRSGTSRMRLVAYRRPLAHRPNYYAQAHESSKGDVNLVNIDLPASLAGATPRFMYLWSPGN